MILQTTVNILHSFCTLCCCWHVRCGGTLHYSQYFILFLHFRSWWSIRLDKALHYSQHVACFQHFLQMLVHVRSWCFVLLSIFCSLCISCMCWCIRCNAATCYSHLFMSFTVFHADVSVWGKMMLYNTINILYRCHCKRCDDAVRHSQHFTWFVCFMQMWRWFTL